jgi:hypothetical protein
MIILHYKLKQMGHYTYEKERAIKTAERFNKESNTDIYSVWEFPKARVWKWYVGTNEQYQHELSLLNKRKTKK